MNARLIERLREHCIAESWHITARDRRSHFRKIARRVVGLHIAYESREPGRSTP